MRSAFCFLLQMVELEDLSEDHWQSFRREPSIANHQEQIRNNALDLHNVSSIKMAPCKRMSIEDMSIYYETHGTGPQVVLLIHGAVGSSNDFRHQVDKDIGLAQECAKLSDKFDRHSINSDDSNQLLTIVTLDLPGQGRSELKHHDIHKAEPVMPYFRLCAQVCGKLMEQLGHRTYSVGGWSDGARVAALLAIERQSRVNCLLLWGFVPVMDDRSINAISRVRDTNVWDPDVLETYVSVYGEQRFSELWRQYVDFIVSTLDLTERFDIRDELKKIKCPTMVLHGTYDPLVNYKGHVEPIEMLIYDSEIMLIDGAPHNMHQAQADKFNRTFAQLINLVSAH